ncbi:hypothetical protein E7V25_22160 [Escherichia coli]|nr:hypothetical protein [Escherichia coli]
MPENPASYRVVRTKSYLFNKARTTVPCWTYRATFKASYNSVTPNLLLRSENAYNCIIIISSYLLYHSLALCRSTRRML